MKNEEIAEILGMVRASIKLAQGRHGTIEHDFGDLYITISGQSPWRKAASPKPAAKKPVPAKKPAPVAVAKPAKPKPAAKKSATNGAAAPTEIADA